MKKNDWILQVAKCVSKILCIFLCIGQDSTKLLCSIMLTKLAWKNLTFNNS